MKREIPNCAKCKWFILHVYSWCKAQGYKDTEEVYNNKLCKKLYEPKEENEKINTNS